MAPLSLSLLPRVQGALRPGALPKPQHVCALSPQVRMAVLRIIGQLVLSGFQDRIKGWGLKYVSVQLTLSTYKLVSGPDMPTVEQLDFGNGFQSIGERMYRSLNLHASAFMTQVHRHMVNCR